MAKRYDRFFTIWALVAHAAFLAGLFYNTFLLGVCVLVGSVIVNATINKEYYFLYDAVTHYLPMAIFLWKPVLIDYHPLLLFPIYLAYMRFDFERLYVYYSRPSIGLRE